MAGRQRIFVVSTGAGPADLEVLRRDLGRHPLVLAPGTPEAQALARPMSDGVRMEPLLAPVSRPAADRGDRLDALVRRHALLDRYRDVVVVTDPASATLLLRVLAPGQLADGPVTVVGLVRGDRPVVVRRAVAAGVAVGVLAVAADRWLPLLAPPGVVAAVGLGGLVVPPARHLGKELLLTAGVAVLTLLAVIAGSARFPGAW